MAPCGELPVTVTVLFCVLRPWEPVYPHHASSLQVHWAIRRLQWSECGMCFSSAENPAPAKPSTPNGSFSTLRQSQCLQTRRRTPTAKWRWATRQKGVSITKERAHAQSHARSSSGNPGRSNHPGQPPSGTPRLWETTTHPVLWVSINDIEQINRN